MFILDCNTRYNRYPPYYTVLYEYVVYIFYAAVTIARAPKRVYEAGRRIEGDDDYPWGSPGCAVGSEFFAGQSSGLRLYGSSTGTGRLRLL
jgi:hypothetical protein